MKTISKKITIKRKEITTSFYKKNMESMEEGYHKIGASIRNNDVCRGLTFDEEEVLLPNLLGVQPKNDNWQKTTSDYWNNISKQVPKDGLELEIGFNYKVSKERSEEENYKLGESCKEEEKYKYGFPINVVDYVLYRYCLVYSDVANSATDKHKSNRIRFYLYSKLEEIKTNHEALTLKNKAYGKYLEVLSNRDKVEDILRLMSDSDGNSLWQINLSDGEQDLILQKAMEEKPAMFISYYDDKVLEMKSFISKCITGQFLKRVPNTEVIMYGENTIIGNTIDEAVGYLRNEKNAQTLNTLRIQTGVVKSKSTTAPVIEKIVNPTLPK